MTTTANTPAASTSGPPARRSPRPASNKDAAGAEPAKPARKAKDTPAAAPVARKASTATGPKRKAATPPTGPQRKAVAPILTADEKAKIAAQEKEKAAIEKAAAQRAALVKMEPLAREINVRLEKAHGLDKKGDEHRVAAAMKLKEAKETAAAAGVAWREWYDKHISTLYGWENAKKLIAVASSPDPMKALEDHRAGVREAVQKHRENKKKEAAAATPPNSYEAAERAMAALDDKSAATIVERAAESMGMKLVKEGAAKPDAVPDSVAAMRFAFEQLPAAEAAAFLEWAAKKIGGSFSM